MSAIGRVATCGALFVLVVGVGCAQTQKKDSPDLRAQDYWPLEVGNAWKYRIQHGGALQEQRVSIVSKNAEGFFVDSEGASLQQHPAGLFDGQRFLLRDPLELGAKWTAVPSANSLERFEIVAIDFNATVPAGIFERCVRVRATNRINDQESYVGEWTYAPGVGLILYQSRHEIAGRPAKPQTEMQLLSFELKNGA